VLVRYHFVCAEHWVVEAHDVRGGSPPDVPGPICESVTEVWVGREPAPRRVRTLTNHTPLRRVPGRDRRRSRLRSRRAPAR
jgi:hypothetical protein